MRVKVQSSIFRASLLRIVSNSNSSTSHVTRQTRSHIQPTITKPGTTRRTPCQHVWPLPILPNLRKCTPSPPLPVPPPSPLHLSHRDRRFVPLRLSGSPAHRNRSTSGGRQTPRAHTKQPRGGRTPPPAPPTQVRRLGVTPAHGDDGSRVGELRRAVSIRLVEGLGGLSGR